jgi:hypothetical protein
MMIDRYEKTMTDYVRENGGISIGVNPEKNLAASFDIVLRGTTWYPLLEFIKKLSP